MSEYFKARLNAIMVRVLFLLAMLAPGARAANPWLKLSTPHFTLYTTAGDKKGREAILYFEQVRAFFMQVSPPRKAREFPVRIVAFGSESEYAPYRPSEAASDFYSRDDKRDYIVMQDISPEKYPVAIHEFTHLVVEHSGLRLPLWLNEGWADVNSTLRPARKETAIGDLLPGRLDALATHEWIPLAELERVGHNSPEYVRGDMAGLFYAESWALVHMLYLAPDYRPHFSKLVLALSSGKNLDQACPEALGKPLADVEADLHQYLKRRKLQGVMFNIKLARAEEEPAVAPVEAFESSLMLADLLAVAHKLDAAKVEYERLAVVNPDRPEIEESLGYLAGEARDEAGALAHFENALRLGTTSAQMCLRLGMLARRDDGQRRVAARALRRALEIEPDYTEARLQLGIVLLESEQWQASLDELAKIKKIAEGDASRYFSAAAFDYLHLGNDIDAAKSMEEARKYAQGGK